MINLTFLNNHINIHQIPIFYVGLENHLSMEISVLKIRQISSYGQPRSGFTCFYRNGRYHYIRKK